MFYLILARDSKNGIGKDGKLPWRLKKDMQFFKKITTSKDLAETEQEFGLQSSILRTSITRNSIIMGRKTYFSIPEKYRPLPGRYNIVLTSSEDFVCGPDVQSIGSVDVLKSFESYGKQDYYQFIAGGSSVYNEFFSLKETTRIYLTEVAGDFKCDTFINDFPEEFKEISCSEDFVENDITFRFKLFQRQAINL